MERSEFGRSDGMLRTGRHDVLSAVRGDSVAFYFVIGISGVRKPSVGSSAVGGVSSAPEAVGTVDPKNRAVTGNGPDVRNGSVKFLFSVCQMVRAVIRSGVSYPLRYRSVPM